MQAYKIRDWVKKYEVDKHGHATKRYENPPQIKELRKLPLAYIRIENTGHAVTTVDRRINGKAWQAGEMVEMAIHGLFLKLLIIAGSQPREHRGWIMDERQQPLDAKGIADVLGIYEVGCVQKALGILTDPAVGLLEACEYRQTSGDFRKLPETSGALYNETETEENRSLNEKANKTKNPSASNSQPLFSASASSAKATPDVGNLAHLKLTGIIVPHNQSDKTTLRHIFEQLSCRIGKGELTTEVFDFMLEKAKSCKRANNPIAMFVDAMKESPFNYTPQRNRVISAAQKVCKRVLTKGVSR